MTLAPIQEAIKAFQQGRFVIIVDDADRENEGDLVIAAQFATPTAINFMATEGRGLICVAMTGADLDRLGLKLMVPPTENRSGFGTAFTISVEARQGVTTGISAYDRARTVQVLADPRSTAADLVQPGHIFPLRAREGGVLARRGQTEAGVDLARLAGLQPAAVICEIMAESGAMARLPELLVFGERHNIKIISVADLADYRREREGAAAPENKVVARNGAYGGKTVVVSRAAAAELPTAYGRFRATAYTDQQGREHLLLSHGELTGAPPLTRLHSECLTGDTLGSWRCDCGQQLQLALQQIAAEGRGLLLYLRQEGRGIGLANKIRAYALQDEGMDTVEANVHLNLPIDARTYEAAAAMLRDQGVTAVRLLTNNPDKIAGLEQYGIEVIERVAAQIPPRAENLHYLRVKADKLGHWLKQ
jgi:3,4-dihydroxy 2-butanone 4-phosphate synthase / GTP cyclohydrolase II